MNRYLDVYLVIIYRYLNMEKTEFITFFYS